ncbi:plasmid mobilization protein [Enterococcus sp. DIV1420a]|uniref:plasmid mobilization protein n=1 Tax=Enterococcus sp. DIV1420a TaxID=2774672 RepID=UPI003F220791
MQKKKLFRNKIIKVYITNDEKKKIRRKMEEAEFKKMSNYMRLMALNGEVVKNDFVTLKEALAETGQYVYELNKIGNNLNQIAHKLNQTDIVEKEDVQFLVSEFTKLKNNYIKSQKVLMQGIRKNIRRD